MFHSFELHDSPENPLEGFEDVDLGPPETFTRDILNDGQCVSPLTNDRVCDAGSCDPETGSPTIKKVRVPSEEAYRQAFSPFHKDIGTPYPCSQSDLDVHKTGSFEASNNHPFVSAMEATKEVMLHNHDHLHRGKELRDNVRVQWVKGTDHPRFEASNRLRGAAIQLPERGKCLILLNADLHLREHGQDEDPLRRIFGTLLHEMCHAYEIVRCGRSCNQASIKRCSYDGFFSTRIAVVHERAVRVLGLWAVGEDELYVQCHFLEGEQTAAGLIVGRVVNLVMDVDHLVVEKVDKVADVARWGVEAVRRWVVNEEVVK